MEAENQVQAKYQVCCDKILQYIKVNQLTSGDQLPTEPKLTEMLGVSRITVRRAITELENQGIVKKIQGSGTFVASPQFAAPSQITVPLVIPGDSTDNALLSLIQGAGERLAQSGYRLETFFSHNGGEDEQKCITQFAEEGIRCAMVFPCDSRVNQHFFPKMERQGMEFVYMGRKPTYASGSYVGPDDVRGGYMAANHLLKQGYTQLAFFSSKPEAESQSVTHRLRGFREALEEQGLPFDENHICCVGDGENFSDALDRLMAQDPRPDAVFCINDITAVQLMYRLEAYQSPRKPKIAVIGFDNSSILKTLPIALSTVEQSFYAMGYEAASTAVQILTNKPPYAVHKLLPVKLLARDTTPKKG